MAVGGIILRVLAGYTTAFFIAGLAILEALTVALLAVRLKAFTFHFLFNLNQSSCDVLCLRLQFALLIRQEGLTLRVTYFVFTRNALTVEPAIPTVLNTLTIQLETLRLLAVARLKFFLTVLIFGRFGLHYWSDGSLRQQLVFWHQAALVLWGLKVALIFNGLLLIVLA